MKGSCLHFNKGIECRLLKKYFYMDSLRFLFSGFISYWIDTCFDCAGNKQLTDQSFKLGPSMGRFHNLIIFCFLWVNRRPRLSSVNP